MTQAQGSSDAPAQHAAAVGGVHFANTATKVPPEARDRVLVCGSHGGVYAGALVARAGVRAAILHDAGVGLDSAGIGALAHFETPGFALATVSHRSAPIGDAERMFQLGEISHCNAVAAALGVRAGMPCAQAVEHLQAARRPQVAFDAIDEARHVLPTPAGAVLCVDSVSLVTEADAGQVVMSGSHGGVVVGQRHLAIRARARLAVYNDAGGGAGCGRLEVLEEQAISAATVAAASARIGDGRSTFLDGVLSAVNACAEKYGLRAGMTAREAARAALEQDSHNATQRSSGAGQ